MAKAGAQPPCSGPRPQSEWSVLATWAVVALAGWIYLWTALQGPNKAFSETPQGYYGLQTAGFMQGHLHLALDPLPALLALPDPYDPEANGALRMHDLTLWQGKYYMYFGVTPVVVFFWPVRMLTGFFPTEALAVALFLTLGLAAGASLLCTLRQRYYSGSPGWVLPVAVACLGLAGPGAQLAYGVRVYEVPIACAHGLHMLTLLVLARAVSSQRSPIRGLALASLLFGLTVGARPNYMPGGLLLVLTCGWVLWRGRGAPGPRPWALLGAACGPATAIGGGLMLYNFLRFGSVTELGFHYQLAASRQGGYVPFSAAYLGQNIRIYLWGFGTWSAYFPYFVPNSAWTIGLIRYLPWTWLGILALLVRHPAARMFAVLVGASAFGNFALLSFFSGVNDRYAIDVAAPWLLNGALGALAVSQAWAGPEARSRLIRAAVLGMAVFSIFIGQAMYFRRLPLDGFRLELARFMNRPTMLLQKLLDRPLGGLRLELELPTDREGTTEPLFQTGYGADHRDWLQIEYLTGNRARLSFFHTGLGPLAGRELVIPADRRLVVEAICGSLVPPLAHPLFAAWSIEDAITIRRDLRIRVNGEEVLHTSLDCHEPASGDLMLGALSWPAKGMADRFSGRILHSERLPFAAPALKPSSP